jgi:hypothetical protein
MLGVWHIAELTGISQVRALLNRGRRTGGLNDNRAGARRRVAPGVRGHVVDRICRYLRRVDQNISRENAVDECPIRQIVALVVVHDCAKVGVGVANVDCCRIVALDADRWGSGRPGNRWCGWGADLH